MMASDASANNQMPSGILAMNEVQLEVSIEGVLTDVALVASEAERGEMKKSEVDSVSTPEVEKDEENHIDNIETAESISIPQEVNAEENHIDGTNTPEAVSDSVDEKAREDHVNGTEFAMSESILHTENFQENHVDENDISESASKSVDESAEETHVDDAANAEAEVQSSINTKSEVLTSEMHISIEGKDSTEPEPQRDSTFAEPEEPSEINLSDVATELEGVYEELRKEKQDNINSDVLVAEVVTEVSQKGISSFPIPTNEKADDTRSESTTKCITTEAHMRSSIEVENGSLTPVNKTISEEADTSLCKPLHGLSLDKVEEPITNESSHFASVEVSSASIAQINRDGCDNTKSSSADPEGSRVVFPKDKEMCGLAPEGAQEHDEELKYNGGTKITVADATVQSFKADPGEALHPETFIRTENKTATASSPLAIKAHVEELRGCDSPRTSAPSNESSLAVLYNKEEVSAMDGKAKDSREHVTFEVTLQSSSKSPQQRESTPGNSHSAEENITETSKPLAELSTAEEVVPSTMDSVDANSCEGDKQAEDGGTLTEPQSESKYSECSFQDTSNLKAMSQSLEEVLTDRVKLKPQGSEGTSIATIPNRETLPKPQQISDFVVSKESHDTKTLYVMEMSNLGSDYALLNKASISGPKFQLEKSMLGEGYLVLNTSQVPEQDPLQVLPHEIGIDNKRKVIPYKLLPRGRKSLFQFKDKAEIWCAGFKSFSWFKKGHRHKRVFNPPSEEFLWNNEGEIGNSNNQACGEMLGSFHYTISCSCVCVTYHEKLIPFDIYVVAVKPDNNTVRQRETCTGKGKQPTVTIQRLEIW
ncbi:hypothetical protein CROQUDRAFT_716541 [Cronartium quercuum f. sp. fusiforme G11]|uniref:Uncharacterized protein n=1 Tax=Cronartium quercuum f. sp. fusiforme G11 TaxID=708437 RepID=A0A9P6TA01_9BASI|nr:hypothetical protein CROQUDRAFT_716541 [Cronartium quercuum f. sp. fusiforme G11]